MPLIQPLEQGQRGYYVSRMICCDRCYDDVTNSKFIPLRNKIICDKCMEEMGAKPVTDINAWLLETPFIEAFNAAFPQKGQIDTSSRPQNNPHKGTNHVQQRGQNVV